MSDYLLKLGKNATTRQLMKRLGVPVPPRLQRASGPWEERPLEGREVIVGGVGKLHDALAETLAPAGAAAHVVAAPVEPYRGPGEAYARPVHELAKDDAGPKADALLFDGTGLVDVKNLRDLYEFFQPRIGQLKRNGRVLVFGRPPADQKSAGEAVAARALEGFSRSVAKELGRKGTTSQVVYVTEGAENRLPGVVRFLLSKRSAFISGQVFEVVKSARLPAEVPWVRPLEGKVALVTGAARGIGAATARRLAEEGAHVVCLDRPADDEPLAKVVREINGSALPQDIIEEGAAERISAHLSEQHGGLDILVHNAGITRDKTLAKMDQSRWDQALNINLGAVVDITERLTDDGVLNSSGRIVCLSSIAGIAGNFGQTNYGASKSGLIGFVQHLSGHLARRGITINAVAPGFIETRLTAAVPFFTREAGRRLANLSQGGRPMDVAEVITFLASPGAAGLTGSVIRVCGGSLLGA